jgi:acyl-CoA synthetase (AMP-forming)/AMP-acid ligase II
MHTSLLLDMAADGFGDRIAFGFASNGLTYAAMRDRALGAAAWFSGRGIENVGLVDLNSPAFPVVLYGASYVGLPFAPVNYRLADDRLRAIVSQLAPGVAIVGDDIVPRLGAIDGVEIITIDEFAMAASLGAGTPERALSPLDPEDTAVLIFTSGTTGDPKAAVLRHRHLTSYVLGSVEFMGADESEATLTSVPPYHIAGISGLLTATYTGRRIVSLPAFDPEHWVDLARDERVTHAMVVPTMLHRILDVLEERDEQLPALLHLAYGGGQMPVAVIERALMLLPHVNFVNAYGLTETASTIALLSPEDHRAAQASNEARVRSRLGSVGRPLLTVEVEIRDPDGDPVAPGTRGEIYVRGEQVSGEYRGGGSQIADGWFATHDSGELDDDGYLFVTGRLDDVIVRGGENVSPGEIEDVLLEHPAVADACVVGVPDEEWGERIAATVVVISPVDDVELTGWVRDRLRSTRTPEHFTRVDALPYNEMGKLIRREVRQRLLAELDTQRV